MAAMITSSSDAGAAGEAEEYLVARRRRRPWPAAAEPVRRCAGLRIAVGMR